MISMVGINEDLGKNQESSYKKFLLQNNLMIYLDDICTDDDHRDGHCLRFASRKIIIVKPDSTDILKEHKDVEDNGSSKINVNRYKYLSPNKFESRI